MERIPIVVLTGFLGSGKTTQLNRWLRERGDLAVIINELGDIGIDQHLTTDQAVPVTLLAGGCVCCVVQGSLSTTLRNLFMARKNGDVPAFSTVVLETTGAAEPFGVTVPLTQDPWVRKRFYCRSVLTVVDARAGPAAIQRHPECLEQIQAADAFLLSKTDQVESLDALRDQLATLNPAAACYQDSVPAAYLDREPGPRCRVTGRFVPVSGQTALSAQPGGSRASRHQLFSASLQWPHALGWPLWQGALAQLAQQCGEALVRVKGLLRVDGLDGPLLVQWVEGSEPEMTPMNHWPDDNRTTRLVLIVRHDQPEFAAQQLAELESLLNKLADMPQA
ncbi:MAG: GTP-binding protein [Pseudomonadales bacterium]|nr:GTP-binding protein [Pseudomonadales bacterium]